MACVWLHPKSKFWYARYTGAEGRRVNRSTKETNRKKAQEVADKWEKAANKARHSELTQAASIKVLNELMEISTGESFNVKSISRFLKDWVIGREKLGRADATAKRYTGVVDSFLEYLDERRRDASIASLTPAEIESWRNHELDGGKGKTTADFGVKVLRAALNAARRHGLILSNPADAVESSGGTAETREPFTDSEISALLDHANKEWQGMILLGVWCGLRLADAANLTWNSVDMKKGILLFQPAKTHNKNKMLELALHSELTTYFNGLTPGVGKAPLFPSLNGRKPGSHGGLSNEFSRLMTKAGVVLKQGREKKGAGRRFKSKGFHALRHTMISRFADAAIPADVRRAIAGHSSDGMHRKYVHLSLKAQRSAIEALPFVAQQKQTDK